MPREKKRNRGDDPVAFAVALDSHPGRGGRIGSSSAVAPFGCANASDRTHARRAGEGSSSYRLAPRSICRLPTVPPSTFRITPVHQAPALELR